MAVLSPNAPAGTEVDLWVSDGQKWLPKPIATPQNRNILHNGDFRVNQYRGSEPVQVAQNTFDNVSDRWVIHTAWAGAPPTPRLQFQNFNLQGSSAPSPPAGQGAVFTALTAPTVQDSDYARFYQNVEWPEMSGLLWGTPQAKKATLSFWAYATFAGVYSGAVTSGSGAGAGPVRAYAFEFTLPAGVWTRVAITIPGDTINQATTWSPPPNNEAALYVGFDLGCGNAHRGTPGVWQAAAANAPGWLCGSLNSVRLLDAVNRQLILTNIQLEAGEVASPYDRRPLAAEIQLCQRYYQSSKFFEVSGYNGAGGGVTGLVSWFTSMRSAPNVIIRSVTGYNYNAGSVTCGYADPTGGVISANATAAGAVALTGFLDLDAEI